jgi:hypothetical protein
VWALAEAPGAVAGMPVADDPGILGYLTIVMVDPRSA